MKIKKSIACVSAVLLASSAFVGCSGSSAGENGTINVFNCGDYIDPSLINQFEKETGIKVNYDTYDTNEIMYQKVKTNPGTYDIVVPSDYMIEKMIAEDMVENIDFSNIPNYKYIGEDYKNLSYDPNNEYSVPYMWGTIGIIYDPSVVTEPVTSWNILWDKQYKDNVYMDNEILEILADIKNSDYAEIAFKLLISYLMKRPDLYNEICKSIKDSWLMKEQNLDFKLETKVISILFDKYNKKKVSEV